MSETSRVSLRKIVPEANMFRQYSVAVGRDLFGQPLVTCAWGRIGARGQEQQHVCESMAEAEALAQKLVQRRLQRGYLVLEPQAARRSTRANAASAPASAAVAAPPRQAKRPRQNAAQLCLLTWLRRAPWQQASVFRPQPAGPSAGRQARELAAWLPMQPDDPALAHRPLRRGGQRGWRAPCICGAGA